MVGGWLGHWDWDWDWEGWYCHRDCQTEHFNWKPCSLLLHLPLRRPPNWKCSQHPYFHTFLLLIPSLGRVQKKCKTCFPILELLPLSFVIGSCKIVRNFRCAHCRKWLTIQTLKLELILRKRKVATNKVFSHFWMVRLKVDLEICPKRTAWEKFSECNSPRVQVANCAGANQGHCRSICCSFLLVFCKGDDL